MDLLQNATVAGERPTDFEIARGDATTVSEDSAWQAFQILKANTPDLDVPVGTEGRTLRSFHQQALESYVGERRAFGRPIFPTRTAEANRVRAEYHRNLFSKPLDEVLQPEDFARMQKRAKMAADPDRYQARMVLKSYLNDVNGSPIPAESFDRYRIDFARQNLGLKGLPDDKTVFAALKDRTTQDVDADKALDGLRSEINARTLESALGASVVPATKEEWQKDGDSLVAKQVPAMPAPDAINPVAEWAKVRDQFPERVREAARESFFRQYRESRELGRRIRPTVDKIERVLRGIAKGSSDMVYEGNFAQAWDDAGAMLPDDPREQALIRSALAQRMQAWGQDERGVLERSLATGVRGVKEYSRGVFSEARASGENFARELGWPDADFREEAGKQFTKTRSLQKLMYAEGDTLRHSADTFLQTGAILATGSLPYILSSVNPAGVTLMSLSMGGNNYTDAVIANPRAPMTGIGTQAENNAALRSRQLALATLSGGVEAKIEQLTTLIGIKWMKGRFPSLAGAMNRAGVSSKLARGAIGGSVTAGAIAGVEYSEEVAQAASNRFTQDVALQLSGVSPDTDWRQFFADWSPTSPQGQDTLAAVTIFALIGGGGASFSHFHYGDYLQKNAALMRTIGVPEATIREAVSAVDVKAADAAMRKAFNEGLETRTAEQKQKFIDTLEAEQQAWTAAGFGNVAEDYNDFTEETVHVFRPPNGAPEQTFESREDALMAWRNWALQDHEAEFDTVQQLANSEVLDMLTGEGQLSEDTRIEDINVRLNPTEAIRRGYATQAEMQARLEVFALQLGQTTAEAAKEFDSLSIRARRFAEVARDGTTRRVVQLFSGHDPINIIEDLAEDAWTRAIDERLADARQLVGWVREAEEATGNAYLAKDYQYDPGSPLRLIEALSAISREYALDQIKITDRFPPAFRRWLDMIVSLAAATFGAGKDIIRQVGRGADLRKAFESGQLSPKFRDLVEDTIGQNTKATETRMQRRYEDQLAAEAMGDFPEISATLKGELPHPDTLRANKHPLAGEVRRIHEAMKTPTRRRRKNGSAVDNSLSANAYFLPVGEMVDLDDVRQRMNEKGFEFDTPADMLDALDSSLNYSKPIYGTNSVAGESSFAIAHRMVQPGAFTGGLSDVAKSTTVAKLTGHADYQAAKKGEDARAAVRVVVGTAKLDIVVAELKKRIDPARPVLVLPVTHRDTGKRVNAIPVMYAEALAGKGGWKLDLSVVKTGGGANTGATGEQRAANRQTFEGDVDTSAQYIIADDTFTSGDTIIALYEYLEAAGAKVSAFTTIASGRYQNYLAHRPQDVAKLLDRAGTDADGFRREIGFPIEQLTGSEVYRFANLDRGWTGIEGLRSRIAPDGSPGDSRGRPQGDGEARSSSFSIGVPPAFFSQLERAIEAKVPNNATPAQILATVDPSRGSGVKAEEIKWSGLEMTLQRLAAENGGKVPKAAILEQLENEGRVQFIENESASKEGEKKEARQAWVDADEKATRLRMDAFDVLEAAKVPRIHALNLVNSLGDGTDLEEDIGIGNRVAPDFDWQGFADAEAAAREAKSRFEAVRTVDPKYADYQLPGGRNYREVVLSMPEQGKVVFTPDNVVPVGPDTEPIATSPELFWYFRTPDNVLQISRSTYPVPADALAYIIREKQPQAPPLENFTSSHFKDVPNYIAHYRANERTDSSGAEGLFIEEIQSDRHQQGRSKGYRGDVPTDQEVRRFFDLLPEANPADYREEMMHHRDHVSGAVPDAPFRKDWPIQLFKRALRDAVASGKQWIGWTNGETQRDRFDLSEQLDGIDAWRMDDARGLYDVNVTLKDGKLKKFTDYTADMLPDLIGKEMAEKIVNDPAVGSDGVHLKGLDLKVGGEGMMGLYDKILPAEVGKYVKKWGGKVGKGLVDTDVESKAVSDSLPDGHPMKHTGGTEIWKVEITDQMRESVAAGQASFALAPKSLARLEEAIARKMTEGPVERAEYYERLRDRLAGLLLRVMDSEAGLGPMPRRATGDPVELERRRINDAIQEAQVILSAFPPEVRGRVRIPTAEILAAKTERGKVNAFRRLIDDADDALEIHLRKEYTEAIEALFDLAKPNLSASKQLAGRLTPETQRNVDKALAAALLTPVELGSKILGLEARIAAMEDGTDAANPPGSPGHIEALDDHDYLETFGAVTTRSAAEMASAYDQLLSVYTKGRTQRRVIEERKRTELAAMRRSVLDDLGRPSQPEYSKRTADKGTGDFLDAFRLGLSSFHQVMEDILPDSPVARDFQERIRKAERSFTRARLDAKDRFESFMTSAFNATKKSARDKILAKLTTRRDDWNIELREGVRFETEKLTAEQAAGIIDGSIKPGWHTDPIAMESLRQALADFRLARRKDQSRAKFVHFERLTNRGAGAWLHMSDLEGLYVLQLAAQSEYLPALDKYGFTKPVLEEMADKIDPQASVVGDHLAREYAAGYDRINPVFRELYGFDMPRIRNYAPGLFEHANAKTESPQDAYGGNQSPVNAMSAGFTKSRQHHMARPRQANALAAYWAHIEQMEYFVAYGEVLREMRAVFRNPDVRRSIEGTRGTRVATLFSQWLDALEVDGRFQATNLLTLAEASTNALATQAGVGLAYNVGVLFKQFSATTGTLRSMPFRNYVKGFVGVMRDPQSLRALWGTETIRQRIEQGFSPEDRKLLDASKAKPSVILDLLAAGRLPIAWVDAALTTISGSIAYQHHKAEATKAGLSPKAAEEFALQQFDRAVMEFAQPATTQDRSMAELTATNAVAKAMIMFRSDPRQKVALTWETLSQLSKGRIGKAEAAKKVLVSWMLYGILAQAGADIWMSISRDDERPDLWNWKKYVASAIAGPISGVIYFGSAIDFGIRKILTGKAYTNNPSPVDAAIEGALRMRFVDTIQTIMEDKEITASDIMEAVVADARAFSLIAGVKDPRFALPAVLARTVRDAAGVVGNTIDLFAKSDAERKREILVEAGKTTKETREVETEDRKDKLKGFLKSSPENQAKQLKELDLTDRRTAGRFRRELALRNLDAEDRQLANLDTDTRAATIRKFLDMMPEGERDGYLRKLDEAGILTKEIREALGK